MCHFRRLENPRSINLLKLRINLLLTLLTLAVCRPGGVSHKLVFGVSHNWSLRSLSDKASTSLVWDVMGSIPVEDSDFSLSHARDTINNLFFFFFFMSNISCIIFLLSHTVNYQADKLRYADVELKKYCGIHVGSIYFFNLVWVLLFEILDPFPVHTYPFSFETNSRPHLSFSNLLRPSTRVRFCLKTDIFFILYFTFHMYQ